jgi:hypothetical protein
LRNFVKHVHRLKSCRYLLRKKQAEPMASSGTADTSESKKQGQPTATSSETDSSESETQAKSTLTLDRILHFVGSASEAECQDAINALSARQRLLKSGKAQPTEASGETDTSKIKALESKIFGDNYLFSGAPSPQPCARCGHGCGLENFLICKCHPRLQFCVYGYHGCPELDLPLS